MTKLQKIENKIYDARNKKYHDQRNWDFGTWVCTKYMTNLQIQWDKAVKEQEEKTGVRVNYNFGDLLC